MSKRKINNKGKNRRKKVAQRAHSTSAKSQGSTQPAANSQEPQQARAQRRILGLLKGHRYDDALVAIDKAFSEDTRMQRIEFLLAHWPQRAVSEIEASIAAGGLESEQAWCAVANRALVVTDETLDAIENADPSRAQELHAARLANELIAAGRDDEAQKALRRISPRSFLREVRLFLTGLLEYYTGNHDRAIAALGRLEESIGYGHAARSICALSAVNLGKLTPNTTCPSLIAIEKLASARQRDILKVQEAQQLLASGKLLTLLGQMERWPVERGANLGYVLRRDVFFAIANKKRTLGPAFEKFVKRTESWDPLDFGGDLLDALVMESAMPASSAVLSWLDYEEELTTRKDTRISSEKRRKARALVLHRAAIRAVEAENQRGAVDFGLGSFLEKMLGAFKEASPETLFERSIDVDSGFPDVHLNLVDYLNKNEQTKDKIRALERFVKLCPDNGDATFNAAQLALSRGAYDKGLKFAAKAAAARPMDRKIQDLQFELLVRKSLKKYKQFKITEARKLWKKAIDEFDSDPRLQSPLLTLVWLSEYGHARGAATQEFEKIWGSLPRSDWLIVFTLLETGHETLMTRPFGLSVEKLEGAPISDWELDYILSRSVNRKSNFMSLSASRLVQSAIRNGIKELQTVHNCLKAANLAPTDELAYWAFDIALKLAPGDPEIVLKKYQKALDIRVEPSVLEIGLGEIETAINKCSPDAGMNPYDAMVLEEQLIDLRHDIRDTIDRAQRAAKQKKRNKHKSEQRKQSAARQMKIPF